MKDKHMEPKAQPKRTKNVNIRRFYTRPILALVAVAVVLLGIASAALLFAPKGDRINNGGYQVVYMISGQVYFGKLKNTKGDYLVLHTAYTPQEVQTPTEEGENTAENKETATTLVKVSQQQYGPTDVMSLRAEQVLFWQNLREDSKVTQALQAKE